MKKMNIITVFTVVVLLTSCMSTEYYSKLEHLPSQEPIEVKDLNEAFAFYKIVFDLEEELIIGHHHRGILKALSKEYYWISSQKMESYYSVDEILEELTKSGYTVTQQDEGMFQTSSDSARFYLGATVYGFQYNSYESFLKKTAEMAMDIKWEVYDAREKKSVFSFNTSSQSLITITSKNKQNIFKKLFRDCLIEGVRNFLSQEEWTTELAELQKEKESIVYDENLLVKISPSGEKIVLPGDTEKLFSSVVVVSTDRAHGSGVIISSDGYILTAAHVVDDEDIVTVQFKSGFEIEGKVVRINHQKDLALLKVVGKNFPSLPLAEKRIGIGKDVYAIGAPLSLELSYSVTKGIVSGYRSYDESEYIQTDTNLNPGNSGGPLLTEDGHLLGIVSWKVSIEGYEGLAFGVDITDIEEDLSIELVKE